MRNVAEQNSGLSDYIYDEKSAMYYSQSTGHLYDPVWPYFIFKLCIIFFFNVPKLKYQCYYVKQSYVINLILC